MSHPFNLLQELLLTLFLALGCAWFAIDLARKLRAPQSSPEPHRESASSAPPAPAPTAPSAVPSAPSSAPAAVAPVVPVAAAEPHVAGVPASHLAAITAAVHHLFKGRVRLASVLPATAAASASAAPIDWAREGRRDIFTSHRVR